MMTEHRPLDVERPEPHSHSERRNEMEAPARVTPPGARQQGAEVAVVKAKGRPMLTWVGKRPLGRVTAYPAQLIERFAAAGVEPTAQGAVDWSDWPAAYPAGGLLFHGDNKDVLAHLLANGFRGRVKLIYIDPPFDSGADYVRKVQLRGPKGTLKIDGEDYALGEQIQYTDIGSNDNYLQFMYERLLLLDRLRHQQGRYPDHRQAAPGDHAGTGGPARRAQPGRTSGEDSRDRVAPALSTRLRHLAGQRL